MSSSGRPLLASGTSPGDPSQGDGFSNSNPNQNPNLGSRPKRTLIENACAACRKRKSKCDGARPTCSRCQNLRTECVYEAEEGESRWSALKRRSQTVQTERDELREILSSLRSETEPEALEIFYRTRSSSSEGLLTTVRQARESASSTHPQSVPPSREAGEQRLPPIRTVVDVPARTCSLP